MGAVDISAEGVRPSPSRLREGLGEGLSTSSEVSPARSKAGPPPTPPASERGAFWELPLESLSRAEWEALCDGCGQCCMHKLEDADTGEIHPTNVACKLLDLETARCTDYRHRRAFVPDCLRLTPRLAATLDWLPETCAYRLRAEGEPLPGWHYLICGDSEAVHRAGVSIRGKAIPEVHAGPLEDHILTYGEQDDEPA